MSSTRKLFESFNKYMNESEKTKYKYDKADIKDYLMKTYKLEGSSAFNGESEEEYEREVDREISGIDFIISETPIQRIDQYIGSSFYGFPYGEVETHLEDGRVFVSNEEDVSLWAAVQLSIASELKESCNHKSKRKAKKRLEEKINKDNIEINEKIRKALRSKSEARKLEPELNKQGIEVDYDKSQGTILKGANGKTLQGDRNHLYGPSRPGFNHTHYKADDSYDKWSKQSAKRAEEYEKQANDAKELKRDDIIRKYPDLSTKDALKANKDSIKNAEEKAKGYREDEKEYRKRQDNVKRAVRRNRRLGHTGDPRSSYIDGISKDSADKIDYKTYLTKKPNGYRVDGANGRAYEDRDFINKNIRDYKDLKYRENSALADIDIRNRHYRPKSDEELKADAKLKREKLNAELKKDREENKKNQEEMNKAVKKVADRQQDIEDFMNKRREERAKKKGSKENE